MWQTYIFYQRIWNIYTWVLKKYRQSKLVIIIGQCVHPEGGKGIFIFASLGYYFIKVHKKTRAIIKEIYIRYFLLLIFLPVAKSLVENCYPGSVVLMEASTSKIFKHRFHFTKLLYNKVNVSPPVLESCSNNNCCLRL